MRSPILIAETPFANGHGPRYLAPPSREVDGDVASYYIGRVREVEQDVEEVEGDDYLAVRLPLPNETNGTTAPEILVLAGIDVDRMSSQERDDVLEQLRERLEVLNDAVAAVDWSIQGYSPVVAGAHIMVDDVAIWFYLSPPFVMVTLCAFVSVVAVNEYEIVKRVVLRARRSLSS